jgi:serine/threonine protein phosphatase PrpC
MAFETPYGMPAPSRLSQSVSAPEADQAPKPLSRSWSFPPLEAPPQSVHGEWVLNSGAAAHGGWEVAWAQAVGKRHRLCEDSLGLAWCGPAQGRQQGLVVALADGVGGGARGDIASHALVSHCLGAAFDPTMGPRQDQLATLLAEADATVNKSLAALTTMPGAATLAAAWLDSSGRGWLCRVGDARLSVLQLTTGNWQPLMADQSYANLGETPPTPDQWHAPARMVGAGLMGQPELVPFAIQSDETLMLSSDGLHEWLNTDLDLAQPIWQQTLLEQVRHMVERARHQGSDDDISVLLVRKATN